MFVIEQSAHFLSFLGFSDFRHRKNPNSVYPTQNQNRELA